MTDPRLAARARELLENSLEQINALRNANVRDANFKEWRQSTLTLFQRLWSGDDIRSERFRRIPFSPPSTRADSKTVRDWFEKGAAEAASLIRSLIDEVVEGGVPQSSGESRPARLDSAPNEAPSQTPEGIPDYEGTSIPRVTPPTSASRVTRPADAAPPRAPRSAESSGREKTHDRSSQEPAARESGSRPKERGGKPNKKNGGKGRLKDMLGFTDEGEALAPQPRSAEPLAPQPRSAEPPEPPRPAELPAKPPFHPSRPMPGTRPRSESSLPVENRLDSSPSAPPKAKHLPPPEPDLPFELDEEPESSESSLQSALEAALGMDNESTDSTSDGDEAEEFLGNSPVFRSKGRPLKSKPTSAPAPAQVHSAAATAVLAIASEIASMGVPEAQCPRARAALLDLAHHLDRHDLSWETIREAITFVMEYPAVARRVLPLLLPYLEDAA